MAATEDTRARPATPPQDDLADALACALLWVDLASMSLHAEQRGRTSHGLLQARTHLRAAIRRLKQNA